MADKVLKQYVTAITRAPGRGERVRKFVISTATPDRDNDTVAVNGWKLDAYRKNPVVLWAHDYAALPLAKCLQVGVEGDRLVAVAEFAAHEFADTVLGLIDGGFLRATSVGFRPLKYSANATRGGYDFTEQELLEFSVVPVPANAEALIAAAAGLKRGRGTFAGDDVVLELSNDDETIDLDEADINAAVADGVTEAVTDFVLDIRYQVDRAIAARRGDVDALLTNEPARRRRVV